MSCKASSRMCFKILRKVCILSGRALVLLVLFQLLSILTMETKGLHAVQVARASKFKWSSSNCAQL